MEYSRLPNYVGRKENNPFSSKEDNWIIRGKMVYNFKLMELHIVKIKVENP